MRFDEDVENLVIYCFVIVAVFEFAYQIIAIDCTMSN